MIPIYTQVYYKFSNTLKWIQFFFNKFSTCYAKAKCMATWLNQLCSLKFLYANFATIRTHEIKCTTKFCKLSDTQ